jgi:hypothetical protein
VKRGLIVSTPRQMSLRLSIVRFLILNAVGGIVISFAE